MPPGPRGGVILVRRTDEPPELATERASRLDPAASTPPGLEGYQVAKPALAEMQRWCCCYCESRQEQAKYRDVEHYRPKAAYWWLTWTWENLYFSCEYCNTDHKKSQFPLEDEAARLRPHEQPPGSERPLVLDPGGPDHPMDHIEFRPLRVGRRDQWRPFGKALRGLETIRLCDLDRPSLLTLYANHVKDIIRPAVKELRGVLGADPRAVFRTWSVICQRVLGPDQRFRALGYDALARLVTPEERREHRLELERPA